MVSKNILICIDRDGTLIYDDKYHLGHQDNWKSLVKLLPETIKGIKLLNKKLPKAKIYIATNQAGIGAKEFPRLTPKRAEQVCKYVLNRFKKKGCKIHGFQYCMHPSPEYVKTHKQFTFKKEYIRKNSRCFKPNPGMILDSLKASNFSKKDTNIYMLGDRASDVQAGINARGLGILTPFKKRLNEIPKVKKLKSRDKYIAKSFLDACKFIVERES